MERKVIGIIPARYDSSRFPGKPLAMILGKSMIERVYEQARKALMLSDVIIATDDERILDEVNRFGGKVVMTSKQHTNGTERCAEVVRKLLYDVDAVINIQGDEPIIDPTQIDQLAEMLLDQSTQIGTLKKKITDTALLDNPNIIKVVCRENSALYFSRSAIPFNRNFPKYEWLSHTDYYKHIGVYGYQKSVLEKLVLLPPSQLELIEQLEQLRWLENGFSIRIAETTAESYSVDMPDDLERIIELLTGLR
jgi:3-deoxy-manno-octulosonate cytidylyltransferase (CMP-KDO synthetase)